MSHPPPPVQQQSRPRSHSRSSSSGSKGGGAYQPSNDTTMTTELDFHFCNSFWCSPPSSTSSSARQEEEDWGRLGYERLLARMKQGTKQLIELARMFAERAQLSSTHSRALLKLSRSLSLPSPPSSSSSSPFSSSPFSSSGPGSGSGSGSAYASPSPDQAHLGRALLLIRTELESSSAQSAEDLAALLRGMEKRVGEFREGRGGRLGAPQATIEKKWKELNNTRMHVLKAKEKYSTDCLTINALHASTSLLHGRELDKATMKLDRATQSVQANERDYRQYVSVLREMTDQWREAWKGFCDLCQDLEEERLEFIKGRLWDWANALSTVAMAEDESAERTRTALEQCEPATDLKIFVQATGSGNAIPEPLPFIDFSLGANPPKQTYQRAQFKRSSTRGVTTSGAAGVKHSPSAVDDIARAFHHQQQQQPPFQQQQQQRGQPTPSASMQSLDRQPQEQPRSQSRAGTNLATPSRQEDPSPSQETTPTRPQQPKMALDSASASTGTGAGSGRFAVSPSANLRGSSERIPSSSSSTSNMPNGGGRSNGHISASAFQQRATASPSPSSGGLTTSISAASAMANSASPILGTSPKPYSAPIPQQQQQESKGPAGGGAEEDDPLAQALRTLRVAVEEKPSSSGTGAGPGVARQSQDGGRPTHRQSQQSLGRSYGAPPAHHGARSRPTSPAPVAAMMQAPSPHQQQQRPSSRPNSTVGAPSNRYSSHSSHHSQSGSQVGIGARGRSPSPQPFAHPDALRPHSPSPNPPRSSSPAPYQQQGFGAGGQQQQYAPQQHQQQQHHQKQPSLGAPGQHVGSQQFARTPSPGPGGYGRAPSPAPSPQKHQQQQQHMGSQQFRSPSPSPHPQQSFHRAPSPQPHAHAQAQQFAPPPQHYGSQQFQQPPPQHSYQQPQQQQQYPSSASIYNNANPSPALVPIQSPYQGAPGASPNPYGAQKPQPHQSFRHPNSTPQSSSSSPYNQAQIPTQQQLGIGRSPSVVSGASSAVSSGAGQGYPQGAPPPVVQQYASPPVQQQQPPQQVQQQPVQHQQPGGGSQVGAPTPVIPPTGQWSEEGKPILFYVNALYNYSAASAEEFSFSEGDVIAVVDTDPDGWWKGNKVGVSGGAKLFPSNFTELL